MKEDSTSHKPGYLPGDFKKAKISIQVKPYTMKELRMLYGMSYKVMRSFLEPITKKIGPVVGRAFNVRQVEIIFEHIGIPYTIQEK